MLLGVLTVRLGPSAALPVLLADAAVRLGLPAVPEASLALPGGVLPGLLGGHPAVLLVHLVGRLASRAAFLLGELLASRAVLREVLPASLALLGEVRLVRLGELLASRVGLPAVLPAPRVGRLASWALLVEHLLEVLPAPEADRQVLPGRLRRPVT